MTVNDYMLDNLIRFRERWNAAGGHSGEDILAGIVIDSVLYSSMINDVIEQLGDVEVVAVDMTRWHGIPLVVRRTGGPSVIFVTSEKAWDLFRR